MFRDGTFLTNDRGRLDEEGRLLPHRVASSVLIDVKGDKVDPVEVEDVLAVHPEGARGRRRGGRQRRPGRGHHQGRDRSGRRLPGARADPVRPRAPLELQGRRRWSSSATRSPGAPPAKCCASTLSSSSEPRTHARRRSPTRRRRARRRPSGPGARGVRDAARDRRPAARARRAPRPPRRIAARAVRRSVPARRGASSCSTARVARAGPPAPDRRPRRRRRARRRRRRRARRGGRWSCPAGIAAWSSRRVVVPGGIGAHKWADRRLLGGARMRDPRSRLPLLLDRDGTGPRGQPRQPVRRPRRDARAPRRPTGASCPGSRARRVLLLADALGMPVREEAVAFERLADADEMFLTGAVRGIEPVRGCDGAFVGPDEAISAAALPRSSAGTGPATLPTIAHEGRPGACPARLKRMPQRTTRDGSPKTPPSCSCSS